MAEREGGDGLVRKVNVGIESVRAILSDGTLYEFDNVDSIEIRKDTMSNTFELSVEGRLPFASTTTPSRRRDYRRHLPREVIVRDGHTVCLWQDGTKTVSEARDGDEFDLTSGILACAIKRWMPGGSNWLGVAADAVGRREGDGQEHIYFGSRGGRGE